MVKDNFHIDADIKQRLQFCLIFRGLIISVFWGFIKNPIRTNNLKYYLLRNLIIVYTEFLHQKVFIVFTLIYYQNIYVLFNGFIEENHLICFFCIYCFILLFCDLGKQNVQIIVNNFNFLSNEDDFGWHPEIVIY